MTSFAITMACLFSRLTSEWRITIQFPFVGFFLLTLPFPSFFNSFAIYTCMWFQCEILELLFFELHVQKNRRKCYTLLICQAVDKWERWWRNDYRNRQTRIHNQKGMILFMNVRSPNVCLYKKIWWTQPDRYRRWWCSVLKTKKTFHFISLVPSAFHDTCVWVRYLPLLFPCF